MAFGLKWIGNAQGGTAPMRNYLIKANEVLAKGDTLTIDDGTGKVKIAAADTPVLGIANATVTGNAGGTNKIETILALPGTVWLADNDNNTDTFAQTDVGEWHDITGTTGAQQIDTDTGAAAPTSSASQWVALEFNPQGLGFDGDTSIGLYTPGYTYWSSQYVE